MAGYVGRDAVIVGAVRTPIGKGKASGALHDVLPVDLLAHSLKELVARTGVDPAQIDDVIAGAVTQVGDQAVNIARNALLGAGFPESVPGTTVDRQCGSSQQAISFAAQGVISGAYDIVVAAGVESMGRVPMGSSVLPGSDPFGAMAQRYPDGLVPQGISAELIAAKWGFSRQQLDEFSAGSHEKAAAATKEGRFDNELTPIAGLATDEIIRPGTTVETLASLKPAFYNPAYEARFPQINWEITAGNSSPLSDGSAAVLITTIGGRQAARPAPAGPHPHGDRRRIGPAVHADRRHPGHREGAAARRAHPRRHRPVRGQRGVRACRAGMGARHRRRSGEDERQRRRDRDRAPARRQRCADHDHDGQRAWSSAAGATRCRRCVKRAAWPTPPSSSGCDARRTESHQQCLLTPPPKSLS